ncbi:hypothetical protein ZEAMMB73_Zm00001d028000 [Zea mays]|uniref:Replication protein A OB domain-containing protein n=1 Tax=Zea mays TaxID=4577 RepID=A0A1D6JR72_MAIZE|nr:hypothetical protein ZEAMMB73_Zm00001d028000 [Zea mays]
MLRQQPLSDFGFPPPALQRPGETGVPNRSPCQPVQSHQSYQAISSPVTHQPGAFASSQQASTLQCGHFDPNFVEALKDAIGMMTQIGAPHVAGYNNSSIVRDIFIKDISDASLKITLWGDQASGFSIDNVCNQSNNKPIVIMFVGCLAKQFKGQSYLSGTTTTTWYFNPDIPEA